MSLYLIANGPMPTTAAQAVVTTGTAIKTLLQVAPSNVVRIVEWGISFSGFAAAAPIQVELLETDVAATITAFSNADVTKFGPGVADQASASVAGLVLGSTVGTGYTATAEGSIVNVRMLDVQLIAPTSQYLKQFPLGREPVLQIGKFGRIRVTAAAAVNAYCYMILDI